MFKKFLFGFLSSLFHLSFSITRMIVIGGLTIAFLIFNIDTLTKTEYGVNNLVLIVVTFAFIPTLLVLFIEIFIWDFRRRIRKKKKTKNEEIEFLDL